MILYFIHLSELENPGGIESWIRTFIKSPFDDIPENDRNKILKTTVIISETVCLSTINGILILQEFR